MAEAEVDLVQAGDAVPAFAVENERSEMVTSATIIGQACVLYFYPKDDTTGCTREALDFQALADDFAALGVAIIGVSPDSAQSHQKFAAKHGLGFTLLADPATTMLQAFGVWVSKSMYGRTYMGVERATFLIDAGGQIVRVWRKVRVPGHVDEVLEAARALRG